MSLEVILEQKSSKTRKELRAEGWLTKKPDNYTPQTHDSIMSSDGYLMFKEKMVTSEPGDPVTGQEPAQPGTPAQTQAPVNQYQKWATVFKFTTQDNKEVRIALDNELTSAIEKWKLAGFDDDDSFVRAVIETYPKVTYIYFVKGTANIKESVKELGLSKLLKEQEYQVITVNRDPNSPNFKLLKGKFEISGVSNRPNVPPQQTGPQQKPATPAKPEGEEMLKKEQQAVEKVSVDEKEGDKLFTTKQKRYIDQYNQEGWTTEKPLQNLLEFHETMDLNEKHPDVFSESLVMYRATTNTPESLKQWADAVGQAAIQDRMLTRGGCRTNIKVYFDLAKQNIEIGEEKLDNLANIVMRCQDKFDNFNDFGLSKKRLYELGNQQGERKRFKLNFSSNTRG